MTDLDGIPAEEHPRPSHIPDIEYEDEPPGAYLGEFRVGWRKLAWSVVNILLVTAIAWIVENPVAAEEAPVLSVIWKLLPASCILSLFVTLWLSVVGREHNSRFVVLACFGMDFVSLLLRFYP